MRAGPKTSIRTLASGLVTGLVCGWLVLAAVSPAGADEPKPCLDWGSAAAIVSKEKLVTVEALTRLAREHLSGDLVRTLLCAENGRYVYKIVVRGPGGHLRNVAVDARKPFAP
jgi:hypothetical protein